MPPCVRYCPSVRILHTTPITHSTTPLSPPDERVGCLTFVCGKSEYVKPVLSQMVIKVRRTWSNGPNHGSRIVDNVLSNPTLMAEWCVAHRWSIWNE